jgi:hypothetical protein
MLMIMILLLIFFSGHDCSQDHEYDQEHEQEKNSAPYNAAADWG